MLQWIALTPLPLKIVSGDRLAAAISFYSPDHPEYVIPSSQTSSEWRLPTVKMLAEGWATMCFEDELGCLNWSNQVSSIALSSVSFNFVVQPQFFGRPGVSTRIYAVVVPPLQIR